jgi:iron-sulfur cluster assembly accessory protein
MFASIFSRKSTTEAPSAAEATIPHAPFPIVLTERAAAMVKEAMQQDPDAGDVLRIGVTGGGCSGLQYMLDFAPPVTELDFANEQEGVSVCIDPFSAAHLAGTTIDYVDGLNGTGFRFENPNVVRACGCGSSFQT